MKAWRKIQVDI